MVQEKVFTRGCQAIVLPTMLTPYVPADWFASPEKECVTVNGRQVHTTMGFFTTWMWNLLGRCPVVNVPNGITAENIPLGMQIISNTFEDLTALQLAHALSELELVFYKTRFPGYK